MKITHIVGVAVAAAALATMLLVPRLVDGAPAPLIIYKYLRQPTLSAAQTIWLAQLMQCESGIKATAINPNDRDNTPSYGILQFKPSTFAAAAAQLGLASTTDYMNATAQVEIVTQWILKGGIDWAQQFPDCTLKLGTPPK